MEVTDRTLPHGDGEAPNSLNGEHQDVPEKQDFSHAGEMLQAAREALDLNHTDLSARINVKAERLEAIEKMDMSALPGQSFTLGFVRSYARELGLPENALVERFRRDAGYPSVKEAMPVAAPKPKEDLGRPSKINLFAVLGLIALVLWMIWQVLERSIPQDARMNEEALNGIPLVERERANDDVIIEQRVSLDDTSSQLSGINVPDLTPVTPIELPEGEVVLPITAEELEQALAAGEAEAREQALANVRSAEEAVEASAELAAASEEILSDDEEDAEAEPEASEPAPSTEGPLSAEELNRRALEAIGRSAAVESATEGEPADSSAQAETSVETVEARTPAVIRTAVEAVYPSRCESAAAETETVSIRYTVSRFGKVVGPEVVNSSNSCFNRAAIAAVSRWDFFAAQSDGSPVADTGRTSRLVFQKP